VYTQCLKCETVFKLSAEVLRAASGQVRCGRCGEVFNALARLAEDSAAFSAGESSLEMETRADSILESAVALHVEVVQTAAKDHEEFGPPGIEIAQLEILDFDTEDGERSMEFTLPPGELDRIFIESKKRAPPASAPASTSAPSPPEAVTETDAVAEAGAAVDAGAVVDTDAVVDADAVTDAYAVLGAEAMTDAEAELVPHPESAAVNIRSARDRTSGFEVPEDVRRDMLAGYEPRRQPERVLRDVGHPSAQRRLILWLGAAIVSALLLMAQVVHQNREWFIAHAHGPFGPVVRMLYGAMGAPLPQPANLSAYQLRQWGVTGDPDANGTLRLRASILNTAAQLQPYPLLRVTLADRFGKSIGARDFEPAEYMGKPTARLLTPGERVDATLEILDPGNSAEGFEVDVCLRGIDKKISCANDVAAQTATR
jgi:predicted Zn finger-like uncharacterized protein